MFTERCRDHHASKKLLKERTHTEQAKDRFLSELLEQKASKDRCLYIHVPYCKNCCSFCTLNKNKSGFNPRLYHKFIIDQLKEQSKFNYITSKPFDSIYFGGGTPTFLDKEQLGEIFDAIYSCLPVSAEAEISLETTISDLTEDKLETLVKYNVNRLSFGVQSFNERARRIFNRRSTGEYAIERLNNVIKNYVKNTNIDLIYNYPEQSLEELNQDIEVIKNLDIAGLSIYSLIINEGSRLSKELTQENLTKLASPGHEQRMFEYIWNNLLDAGFSAFELTKMVKKDRDFYKYIRIKNTNGDCVAIGLGAGGRIGNYIYSNTNSYVPVSEHLPFSAKASIVDEHYDRINYIFGALQFGSFRYTDILETTGIDVASLCKDSIITLQEEGYIAKDREQFSLMPKGFYWGNNICNLVCGDIINKIL